MQHYCSSPTSCSVVLLGHLRLVRVQHCPASCSLSKHQVSFYEKPMIIVCNKSDLQPFDGLSEKDVKLVMEMKAEAMKTVMGQGGELQEGCY